MDLKQEIMADSRNASFTAQGLEPIYMIAPTVKILIIGQAPGAVVEQTGILFNDKSGDRLREWMGIDRTTFYDSGLIGVIPSVAYRFHFIPFLFQLFDHLPDSSPGYLEPLTDLLPGNLVLTLPQRF